jgi:hypothetical protein
MMVRFVNQIEFPDRNLPIYGLASRTAVAEIEWVACEHRPFATSPGHIEIDAIDLIPKVREIEVVFRQ